ncbi:hypothetical protein, partial [Staphylococcus hominis]
FETNNTGNDLHGRGANQQEDVAQSNATKHYDRDTFETNNSGNDLHGRGVNQPNGDVYTNATKHYDRDAFETNNSGNDLHGHGVNQLDQNNFVNTPHYNRDDYESYNHPKFSNQAASDTNQEIDYKTYYNDPRFKSRKHFIVSFITGAIIGSTIGLLTKNKANQKIEDLKAKEQEVKDNYYSIKQQTEETIDNVRHKIEDLKNRKNTGISSDELAAQRRAIQSETSNHLADESPLAKEIQEAKAETTVKENNYFNNEHNSAEEIVAQQNAIKDELSTNLADESPQAQEIQEAKKEAIAKDEKQEETDALAAQRRAVQNESEINQLSNPARSHQTQNSENESQASKIASAARTKQAKLKDNKDVASNTQKLFEEAPITSSKYDKVPNLITKNHKSFNKDEEITKNKQTHHDAKFEKGVITHQHQPSQSNSNQKNKKHNQKRKNQNQKNQNKNKTPKQQQRAEKANSKIEKRTFND